MSRTILRRMLKPCLILVGVILICSLIGMVVGFFIPTEKTEEVTLANYSHQGEFGYKGYSGSGLFTKEPAQPNPVLSPQIIEEMEILFSYFGFGSEKPSVKAILEDRNGNWQKEIPLETTGTSTISFPLDLEEILLLGETINAELKGEDLEERLEEEEELSKKELEEELIERGSNFLLRIIAEVGKGSDVFVATLEGELNSSTLRWKEEGFNKAERGYPGENDWCQGAFGYRVKLKENELFGPITLERKPDLPGMVVVNPDFSLFTDLVESLDVSLDYQFESDVQINSLEEEVKVWMVIEEPERWKKSFTLLWPTKKQDEFTLSFPLDVGKLKEMAEDIDEEIGNRGARGQEITIFTQVHTVAETDSGTIDEVFEHQLRGKIGEKIEWGFTEEGKKDEEVLTLIQEGAITKEITKINLISQKLRKFCPIGLAVTAFLFLGLLIVSWSRKPKFSLAEEAKKSKKKYKGLLGEVAECPSIREEETVIDMVSLEELVKTANNLLKPVLHKLEPNEHIYWIVDGLTRYRYVVKEE